MISDIFDDLDDRLCTFFVKVNKTYQAVKVVEPFLAFDEMTFLPLAVRST